MAMKSNTALAIIAAIAAFSLSCSTASRAEGVYMGNPESQRLVRQGDTLERQGKIGEAFDAFVAAAKADSASSFPLSHLADLNYHLALTAPADKVKELRARARQGAEDALALLPIDPWALQVMRGLDDGEPPLRHKAPPQAEEEMRKAEALFADKQLDDAITHYQKALEYDPQYVEAMVFLGDCYFHQQHYAAAEAAYRKATTIDPLNGQAWRFLGDALAHEGKVNEIEPVLLRSIAAAPNDIPAWDHMAYYLHSVGVSLSRLNLHMRAFHDGQENSWTIVMPKDGKRDEADAALDAQGKPDSIVLWSGFPIMEGLVANTHPEYSPFQRDLAVWELILSRAEKSAVNGKLATSDPGLNILYTLHTEGRLKPALLLLAFHERYRPDFDAWQKENPNGIHDFIHQTGLRP